MQRFRIWDQILGLGFTIYAWVQVRVKDQNLGLGLGV
jgi:hypothetical protein